MTQYFGDTGIKADTVSEVTSGAGVTADGVLLKDSEATVADEAYGSGWNGSLEVPTKNAVYDKIQTILGSTALTQTYATADATHANPTATTLTSNGVSSDNTLVDVTTTGLADPAKINANFDDAADEINKLIADVADVKQFVNAIADILQAQGLAS